MRHQRAMIVSTQSNRHCSSAWIEALEDRRLLASGTLDYAITFGQHKKADSGYAVTADAAGNAYVTGTFQGTIDVDPSSRQYLLKTGKGNGAFIIKYSPTGQLVWAKRLTGPGQARGLQIKLGPTGDVYVAGSYGKTIGFGGKAKTVFTSRGGQDVFLLRFSNNGKLRWTGNIGGPKTDGINAMAIGPDGDIYVGGWVRLNGDIDPGPGMLNITTRGTDDTFVERISSLDGGIVWYITYGESDTREDPSGMVVNADGSLFIAGNFMKTVEFDRQDPAFNRTSNGTRADVYVGQLGAGTGQNARWNFLTTFGGRDEDLSNGLAMTPAADALYITGQFTESTEFDGGATVINGIGKTDAYLTRFTSAGEFVWAKQIGGDDAQIQAAGVAADDTGAAYVTGYFNEDLIVSPGPDQVELTTDKSGDARSPLSTIREPEVYIAKFNPDGSLANAQQIGGDDAAIMSTAIATGPAGAVFLTGNFNGIADLDPGPGVLIGETDDNRKESAAFLIKFLD